MVLFDFLRIGLILAASVALLIVIRKQITDAASTGFWLLASGIGMLIVGLTLWSLYNSSFLSETSYPFIRIVAGYFCFPLGIAAILAGVFYTLRASIIPISQPGTGDEIITAEASLTPERIRLYHSMFSNDDSARFLIRKGQFIDCNQQALSLFQCSEKEILETRPDHFFALMQQHIKGKVDFKKKISQAEKGAAQRFECRFTPAIGEEIFTAVLVELHELPGLSKNPVSVKIRDITSVKHTEYDLARQRNLFASTINRISDAVILTDEAGKIVFVNSNAEELLDTPYSEAVEQHYSDLITLLDPVSQESIPAPIENTLDSSEDTSLEKRVLLQGKTGDQHLVEASSIPILDDDGTLTGTILVVRNVTDRRRMEEELWQAKKLESVGELAGKYAHDFNNILASLLGDIALGKIHCDRQEKVLKYLKNAEKSTERARQLTSQLLTLTTGGRPNSSRVALPELVEEAMEFALRHSSIRSRIAIPEDIHLLEIDAGQIKNVLHNIIINAKEALPGDGMITMTAENADIFNGQSIGSLVHGSYVKIQISDNGVGIPEEYLPQVFEPFFSTKEHGNGLGLASAYSIVKNHGGHIEISSEVDQGTTVTLYLPAHISGGPALTSDSDTSQSNGKILIMDDEQRAREFCGELLEYLGHRVFYAPTGEEALEMYRVAKEKAQAFDAVILDLTVPGGMGGKSTVKQLLDYDPDAKAIVSNGYFNDPVMANYSEFGFQGVITKPYALDEVNRVVQEVLSRE